MTRDDALASLSKSFKGKIQDKTEFRGETTYTISASDLREIAKFCQDELSFDYLIDITSIDNFGEEPRFEIVYHLYSMPHAVHLRLKLKVPEDVAAADTVSDIWPTANWHEQRPSQSASHFDVGWLSLLSAAKRFSASRFAERNARRRFH